jgi:flagellar assembly protein FliH
MKAPVASHLLRNIAFHADPLALVRPHSGRGQPEAVAPQTGECAPAALSSARVATPAQDAAYVEGLARGREEGRRIGLERGMAEADARIQEAVAAARAALDAEAARRDESASKARATLVRGLNDLRREFEAAAQARLESLEGDAISLAFEAVCRIVGEGAEQAEQVARCVRTSMQALRGQGLLRVRLHPGDLERLRETAEGVAMTGRSDVTQWVADPGVISGGCIFDTDLGSVDARMDVQLSRLRQAWSEAVARCLDAATEARS